MDWLYYSTSSESCVAVASGRGQTLAAVTEDAAPTSCWRQCFIPLSTSLRVNTALHTPLSPLFVLSCRGVGFSFIFFLLLMLLTAGLFAAGSLSTSQACWTIENPGQAAADLKNLYSLNFNFSETLSLQQGLQAYE